jgi:hypothetical protein
MLIGQLALVGGLAVAPGDPLIVCRSLVHFESSLHAIADTLSRHWQHRIAVLGGVDLSRVPLRKIAARWKEWEPWVWLYLRHQGYALAGSPELARLRQRHSGHIVGFMQRGVAMRLIRRHRLDDPRITHELRMVLMQAAIGRCKKARLARHPSSQDSTIQPSATGDSQQGSESSTIDPAPRNIFPSQSTPVTIDLIQKRVSEHFHLPELRRTLSHGFLLPRYL